MYQPVKRLSKKQGISYSAPARVLSMNGSGEKSTLPYTWKFVSKYENRSNGGIPIFSEERLQERKQVNSWNYHEQNCLLQNCCTEKSTITKW